MGLENLKRWHWAVIGGVLGLALGAARVGMGTDWDAGVGRTINVPVFEAYVLHNRGFGVRDVRVKDLVVHPPREGVDWVTGVASVTFEGPVDRKNQKPEMALQREDRPFLFSVTVPRDKSSDRRLALGELAPGTTNRQYLDQLSAKFPNQKIQYRYAWWEAPSMQFGLWAIGTAVLVGGVWPAIISLLAGMGLAPAPKMREEMDFSRYGKGKAEAPDLKKPEMSASDQDQLTAVEAELERNLASGEGLGARPESPVSDQPAQPTIRPLTAGPLKPAAETQQKQEEKKEYAGQFYPTVAHAPAEKREGEPAESKRS